jgi:hypothetical protein
VKSPCAGLKPARSEGPADEVSDARRLKALAEEQAKLKQLVAEAMLNHARLRDVAARKW